MSLAFDTPDHNPRARTFGAANPAISAKGDKRPFFDRVLSQAFRDIEDAVCNLNSAGHVLAMIMDRKLGKADPEKDELKFEMTRDEWETLFYAMYQVTNQATALRDSYFKAFDGLKTEGSA